MKSAKSLRGNGFGRAVGDMAALCHLHGVATHGISIYEAADRLIALRSIPVEANFDKRERLLAALKWGRATGFHRNRSNPKKPIGDAFYDSWEWKRLRYEVLRERGPICECCGTTAAHGVRIVVDHIQPVRRYPERRLDKANLQILCDDCNMGKGSRDETDWRE